MLNYTQIEKDIEEKGTEEIKYKLYNSEMNNTELYNMYQEVTDHINRNMKIDKKRARMCRNIVDIIYNHGLYYKKTADEKQLRKVHENILKRDSYLKAKGLDNFETLIKREEDD